MPTIKTSILHSLPARLLTGLILTLLPLLGSAQNYARESVLNQGKWVKINIKEEGMQLLTPAALNGMGFSDPSKVHVYGYGGYILPETLNDANPDDLPQQPVVRLADGSIVFYGAGLVKWDNEPGTFGYRHFNNYYSTVAPYFLSDRDATDTAPAPVTTPVAAGAAEVRSFPQLLVHEQDLFAPATTGADLFGEDFRTTTQRTFNFPVTDAANDNITFNCFFADKNSNGSATVTYSSGGKTIATARQNACTSDQFIRVTRAFATGSIGGKPTADLTVKYNGSGSVARLDFIEARYDRKLKLDNGVLQFRHVPKGAQVLCVEGCSSATNIWDVTDPAAPKQVAFELSGNTARFAPAGSGLRTYVAFNPASVKNAPAAAGSVKTQNIHGMEVPQLVIIVPSAYRAQAERIADYHRTADNMVVHVLDPEDIYNEFSSGKPDVTAYRRMLKMFYDRGKSGQGTRLENCLLFGRPSYDHRLLTETPRSANYPRLLTYENTIESLGVRTSTDNNNSTAASQTNSYCADTYIGTLETCNSFSMATAQVSIGIGRMPVKSSLEAKSSVDKLLGYLKDPDYGAWRSRVMIIADDGDDAAHLNQAQKMYNNMVAQGSAGRNFTYERLYLDSYPVSSGNTEKTFPQAKERMFKMLNDGVSLMAYIGHANPTSWTADDLMNYTDINSVSYKHLPIIYHASCEFVRFDDDAESGAETMWLNPTSGAIAFLAANRKVYVHLNENMNAAFGNHYFAREADGSPITLGEVFRRTVNSCPNGTNQHRYALMGDPAMRVPSPTGSVKIESFAGIDLDKAEADNNLPVIPARSTLKVKGQVRLANGAVNTDFNGTLCATLFDAERVIETYGHPSSSGTVPPDGKVSIYNDRKNRLAVASFPVKNGEWEATLFLPEEIDNNYTPALLALYAYTPEGAEAIGSTESFYVYGYDDNLPADDEAPVIEMAALGTSMFRPGDIVASNTTFLAKVKDESGINISTAGIGKALTLVLDGRKVYDDLSDYFVTDPEDPTAGSINYPLDGLTEGTHELVFQVFDNAGNCSKATLPFKVGGQGYVAEVDLRTDASPASVEATFFVTTARQPQTAVVEVFDLTGRCVWRTVPEHLSQSMNVTWNLTNSTGQRVPRGIYLYSATITCDDGSTHRKTRKLAVTAE